MTNLMLTVLTNGREDVFYTVPAAQDMLDCEFNLKVMVDDSGDNEFNERIHDEFGADFVIVRPALDNMGFTYAMGKVMRLVSDFRPDYVWMQEEDFIIERKVDVPAMIEVLAKRDLLQIALMRQSWWDNEKRHGGVIEAREADGGIFHRMHDGTHSWIEHRDHWCNGPNLFPADLASLGWPQVPWSESTWGNLLRVTYPVNSFAYWGEGEPWVEHVGQRTGVGY